MRVKLRPNAFLTFGLETYCFRHSLNASKKPPILADGRPNYPY